MNNYERQIQREAKAIEVALAKFMKDQSDAEAFNNGSNTVWAITFKRKLYLDILAGVEQELVDAQNPELRGTDKVNIKTSAATAAIEKCLGVSLVCKSVKLTDDDLRKSSKTASKQKTKIEYAVAKQMKQYFDLRSAVFIAMQVCLDAAAAGHHLIKEFNPKSGEWRRGFEAPTLTKLQKKIGERVMEQVCCARMSKNMPSWWRHADRFASGEYNKDEQLPASTAHWRKSIKDCVERERAEIAMNEELSQEIRSALIDTLSWKPWTGEQQIHIGAWLTSAVIRHSSGLLEPVVINTNDRNGEYLKLSSKGESEQANIWADTAALIYDRSPMVCEPLPNEERKLRGWLNQAAHIRPVGYEGHLVISDNHLALANKLQATPFRINPFVADVMELLVEKDIKLGKFNYHLYKAPESVASRLGYSSINDKDEQDELVYGDPNFKAAKRARSTDHKREQKRVAVAVTTRALWAAIQKVRAEDKIYLPVAWDFRGRLMYRTLPLSPQGVDPSKAVLQWGVPTKTDRRTAFWLKVELANCAGQDKRPFDQREQWVEDNMADIINVATMLDTGDFSRAISFLETIDDPWQFLAAAEEFYHCCVVGDRKTTRLRTSVDATAQGSQICNGWRKSKDGAVKCNLLPTETPGDVYKAIWEAIVDEACHRGSIRPKILKAWKEKGYGRMIAKKAIFMGGQYGCRLGQMRRDFHKLHWEDIPEEYWMNAVEWHLLFDKPEDGLSVVELAINKVCSITAIVRWFRERAAEVHASGKRYLKIPAPNGNLVFMKYAEETTTRVRTFHHGSLKVNDHAVRLKGFKRTADLKDWEKAVLANVVHTADASLLCDALYDLPLNISTVHDSIASAPGKGMDILVDRLKQAMHKTITWDVWGQFLEVNGLEMTPTTAPPIIGTLDPNDILNSTYLFC